MPLEVAPPGICSLLYFIDVGLLQASNLEQIKYLPSFFLTTAHREKWNFINTSHSGVSSIFNGTSVLIPQNRDHLHGGIFEWQAARRNLGLVVEQQSGLFCLVLSCSVQGSGSGQCFLPAFTVPMR